VKDFLEPILHVDMDAFFVEVERLRDPGLRHKPVVVGGTGNRGVVASASYEARKFGVRSAMPMSTARRMCPDLVVVPTAHDEYQRMSEMVFGIFREFTPLVEGLSLDEAFLDVAGLRRVYQHPIEIGHGIRKRVRAELGLPASVGIAATKFVAKLASEIAKPDGLKHIPRADTLGFLHALPVRSLWGVGEATHAALEQLGVAKVGDLTTIDLRTLENRLGVSNGSHLAALARGEDPRQVVADTAAKSISVSETYEHDLTNSQQVDTELLRLCDRLGSRMRRSGLAGRTISLKVRYSDFTTINRSITFDHSTDNSHELRRAVKLLADKVEWARPVRLLGVEVGTLVEGGSPRQLSTEEPPKWGDLADAVEQIRGRYGVRAIKPARLQDPVKKPTHPGSD
jgi:DNA polymerase-4